MGGWMSGWGMNGEWMMDHGRSERSVSILDGRSLCGCDWTERFTDHQNNNVHALSGHFYSAVSLAQSALQ